MNSFWSNMTLIHNEFKGGPPLEFSFEHLLEDFDGLIFLTRFDLKGEFSSLPTASYARFHFQMAGKKDAFACCSLQASDTITKT